jgi:hypothetical protein
MADLTITAATVLMSAAGKSATGIAGEAITAGDALYRDAADGKKMKLGDANAVGKRDILGIALNDAAVGQPVEYCTSDPALVIGGTVSIGYIAILSGTPGAIAPAADAAAGMEVVVLGIGVSTTALKVNFAAATLPRSGAVIPA